MRKTFIVLMHAFVGWAFCGAIMGIGPQLMTMQTTLVVHAIGGPVGFLVLSLFYFKKFNYTTPLQTAGIFVGFVIFVDFLIVSFLILKHFDMFKSALGTWIPFLLIFLSTYLTGLFINSKKGNKR